MWMKICRSDGSMAETDIRTSPKLASKVIILLLSDISQEGISNRLLNRQMILVGEVVA